jgi:hypothetical protein
VEANVEERSCSKEPFTHTETGRARSSCCTEGDVDEAGDDDDGDAIDESGNNWRNSSSCFGHKEGDDDDEVASAGIVDRWDDPDDANAEGRSEGVEFSNNS